MKTIYIQFLILFTFACTCGRSKSPPPPMISVTQVKQNKMSAVRINGATAFKADVTIGNVSKSYTLRKIILKADLYNKAGETIASKLLPVSFTLSRKNKKNKPSPSEGMMGKIKYNLFRRSHGPSIREKAKYRTRLEPGEKKDVPVIFYPSDLSYSKIRDKYPVSYSVKIYKADMVKQ